MPARRRTRGAWFARGLILLAGAACSIPALAADSTALACAQAPDAPNILILSLDGVAYGVVEAARAKGAFAGWPETRPLVSTFPSMTNLAFSSIFSSVRAERMDGYELRHYDYATNRVVGGTSGRAGSWREHYDVMHNTVMSKAKAYLQPRGDVGDSLDEIERFVLESPRPLMLAHVKSTDVLAHLRGNDAVEAMTVELSRRLDALAAAHLEAWKRPLGFVLLSDHGNTEQKVYFRRGIRERLRGAGLRPADRLERPGDVVAPTYGAVSFGVLFTAPQNAERAGRAVIDHPAVDLAAWIVEPGALRVISDEGEATLRWREDSGERRYAYTVISGDPLRLAAAQDALARNGRIDAEGFAADRDWFERTATADYPDALHRLVDALTGAWVRNAATVILSLEPGYAWGQAMVRFGAWLGGGRQEGTHGGLDRESSLGFFLTSDGARQPPGAVRADVALTAWAPAFSCREDATASAGAPGCRTME